MPFHLTFVLGESIRDVLDHFAAHLGTCATLFGTFGHVCFVWPLLAFGSAVVARVRADLAHHISERSLAGGQSCRNPADSSTVITELHTGGVLLVSAGNMMHTMLVTFVAFSHAPGTLGCALRVVGHLHFSVSFE